MQESNLLQEHWRKSSIVSSVHSLPEISFSSNHLSQEQRDSVFKRFAAERPLSNYLPPPPRFLNDSNSGVGGAGMGGGGMGGAGMGGMDSSRLSVVSSVSVRSFRSNTSLRARKTSITLMHDKHAIHAYREAAKKTRDLQVQWEYVKLLLDCLKEAQEITSSITTGALPFPLEMSTPTSTTLDLLETTSSVGGGEEGEEEEEEPPQTDSLGEEVIYWVVRLNKANHADAIVLNAQWLENGDMKSYGIEKDAEKAFLMYQRAAKLGNAEAVYKMAQFYEQKKRDDAAKQFYLKASAAGHPGANYRIAKFYLNGEMKCSVNYQTAMRYLIRSADVATREYPKAPYLLALLQADQHPRYKLPRSMLYHDLNEARRRLSQAAELGVIEAICEMAWVYEYGGLGLSAPDPLRSFHWYEVGASVHQEPEAMLGLSGWYLTGVSEGYIPPSEKLAFEWCEKAANLGYARAEFALSCYYYDGMWVEADREEALKWCEKAVLHGCKEAEEFLSKITSQNSAEESNGESEEREEVPQAVQQMRQSKAAKQGRKRRRDCLIM